MGIADMMKLYRSFAAIIFLSTVFSASCSKATPPASSTAGSLTANSAINSLAARPFSRQTLNAAGGNYLNQFILPEVRARLDEEPVGDADSGFDPSTIDPATSSDQVGTSESSAEPQNEDAQQPAPAESEEGYPAGSRLDTLKYAWAKKAFGEAVKASPTNSGVIVLYADENYYDAEKLTRFVEEGRDRIAESAAIPGDRIQVVFGGYRAIPQVELWVVPQGGPMPEFKTDDRSKPAEPAE
jgi:hypothetical protein